MVAAARPAPAGRSEWSVVGGEPSLFVDAANAFLGDLAARGRQTYTQRSYALALAHLIAWLDRNAAGVPLHCLDDSLIARYVSDFERGEDQIGERVGRAPATVRHRLSVVMSFRDHATGGWPTPQSSSSTRRMAGRDAPSRWRRQELRRSPPRTIPRAVEADVATALIDAATSWRNKALLTLMRRTGQRVGDWHELHGRHGLLGLALGDVDATGMTIRVMLKGARDEHLVPVTDDFWPLWDAYLRHERGDAPTRAAWVGARRGRDQPLSYGAFEAALRHLGQQVGVRVTAHMFRHAFAQAVMNSAGLKVAQELLGHAHLSTTADTYLHTDAGAMVDAVAAARRMTQPPVGERRWAFPYDDVTIAELDDLTNRSHEPDTAVRST